MPNTDRYYAAACQIDSPNPRMREEIAARTRRMLDLIDFAVTGYNSIFRCAAYRVSRVRPRCPDLSDGRAATGATGAAHSQRAYRRLSAQGQGTRRIYPDRLVPGIRPGLAGPCFQHDMSRRSRRHSLQVPQGAPLDSLGNPHQSPRPAGLQRGIVSGRPHGNR